MAVTGIGGDLFRADDPGALVQWYEQHLGPTPGPLLWMQEEGPTVFAPYSRYRLFPGPLASGKKRLKSPGCNHPKRERSRHAGCKDELRRDLCGAGPRLP